MKLVESTVLGRIEAAKMCKNKFLGTSSLEDVKKASVQMSMDVC